MAVNFTRIAEGAAFTAASLNSRFTALKDHINALDPSDLQRYALGAEHVDDTVIGDPNSDIAGTIESQATGFRQYTNLYPGYNTDTYVDPPTGGSGNTEWNLVTDGTRDAQLTWTRIGLTSSSNPAGLLVLANVERVMINMNTIGGVADRAVSVAFALMYRDSSDDWNIIPRTERFISGEIVTSSDGAGGGSVNWVYGYHDVAIRCLITHVDAEIPQGYIKGVQLVCALNRNSGVSPAAYSSAGYSLRHFNLSVVPLRAAAGLS